MALTKKQKAMRKKPVTEAFRPCRVEKRDRSSNVLKRLGRTGALNYYVAELRMLDLEKVKCRITIDLMKSQSLEKVDGYTIWHYRWKLQNVNNRIERYKRFLINLLNNNLTARDLPNNHD